MSAQDEEDQTCQTVDFGENLRLVNPALDQRLHFDGSTLSVWALPDGSGDTDDNWTLLNGTGGDEGGEWQVAGHCTVSQHILCALYLVQVAGKNHNLTAAFSVCSLMRRLC